MRRGSLRPHSPSAPRRGRIPLDYLRELACVSVIIALVLVVQQSFDSSAATTTEHPHAGHPVYSLAISQRGERLWISREMYGLSEIDLNDGTECEHHRLCHAEASYAAHGGSDHPLTLRFGFDGSLELMRGNESVHSEVLSEPFLHISESSVSADGRTAMIITTTGLLKLWNEQPDGTFSTQEFCLPVGVDYASLTHDGRRAVLVSATDVVWWDLEAGKEIASWSHSANVAKMRVPPGRAEAAALSADDGYLAVGFSNGLVRMWDCATRELVWERQIDPYKASALAFSESGLLATAGFDKTIRVWDWRTNTLKWERTHHARPVHNLVFAAEETRLYSGGLDGQVLELSAVTGELMRHLP